MDLTLRFATAVDGGETGEGLLSFPTNPVVFEGQGFGVVDVLVVEGEVEFFVFPGFSGFSVV